MSKLDWVYQDRARVSEYRASYKGMTLRAVHDSDPSNPFEDCDGHWPIAVRSPDSFRGIHTYESNMATSLFEPLQLMTDEQLVHDQIGIAKALKVTVEEALDAHGYEAVKYSRNAGDLRDAFDQVLADSENSDKLEAVRAIYEIIGVPAIVTTSNGHCQGDWAEILVVAPPDVAKKFGCADVKTEDLEATADLYGDWAWGNVFGYIIEDAEGDEIDSCWGYYGDEFDKSGLEEAALNAADCHARSLLRARLTKLKTLIRNKVALALRPALLDEAGVLAHG